jgi:hypothetical protein
MPVPLLATQATLDASRFAVPPAIYRGAPFWSWNGDMKRERLFRQIDVFKAMGIGGFHMHVRTGMSTRYMGEEYLALVRDCADYGAKTGLVPWLYDEDRWPSGFAGGLVTSDPTLRIRQLRLTRRACAPGEERPAPVHHSGPLPVRERQFLAAWALQWKDGRILTSRRIAENENPRSGETVLFAYLEVAPAFSWFNDQQYVDVLSKKAMARFIEVTHEAYAKALGDRLGRTIPAIFTDEPLFRTMTWPASSEDSNDQFLSWTGDLPETYRARFGEDVLDVLPGVLFDRVDGSHARARWRFREHHTGRFVEAFAARTYTS